MRLRSPFGPVFSVESLLAARRWQVYVGRSIFVGFLLLCLSTIWGHEYEYFPVEYSYRLLVMAGERFHQLMVVVEIVLMLLAAPAAMAGSICLEKSRGSLTHLLTTQLSAREIVLGKLAARSLPVMAILACAVPMAIIAALLGGVDYEQLIADFIIVSSLAVLGCSLTTLVSVWGSKPHEVLCVVYSVWALWILPWAFLQQIDDGTYTPILNWIRPAIPFWAAFQATVAPLGIVQQPILAALVFAAIMIPLSLIFTWLAVISLHPAALRDAERKRKPVVESKAARRFRRDVPWWPSPSLDKNPVLWREWHRNRPTQWTRVVWTVYLGMTGLASAVCILSNLEILNPRFGSENSGLVAGMSAALGFLLMSVTAATSLAEERVRGSLDVLLATPLSTALIVMGKWRGTFRLTPLVLLWPIVVCYSLVLHILPDMKVFAFYVILAYGFALGAFVSSLGLALACWAGQLGRALGLAVALYTAIAVGFPLLSMDSDHSWSLASPFIALYRLSDLMSRRGNSFWGETEDACLGWAITYGTLAIGLYVAVRLSFNPCMGRMNEVSKRPGPQPQTS